MTNVNRPSRQPLSVSIITPCLDRAATIKQAVESVIAQQYPDIEHVVVDGGSTDGTLDVLQEYPAVISKPGSGLYEALNHGIKASRGDIIGQLNGDDLYTQDAISAVADAFKRHDVDSVCGGAEVFRERPDGQRVMARLNGKSVKQLRLANIIHGIPIINARFFRRAVYHRVGFYSDTYRIVSDRDFLLRAWCAGISETQVRGVVYRYRMHENSLTLSGGPSEAMLQENVQAAQAGRSRSGEDRCLVSAYRRWHAWAVGYRFGADVSGGRYRAALRGALEATARSPLWPLLFTGQVVNHWLTRSERRWSDESA